MNGVKVWKVLYARYESANPMDEHFKVINAYLPVEHTIFLRQAADVDGNGQNPHHHGLNLFAHRLLAINPKFIRGKSSLVLAKIYSLCMNAVRFAPLSDALWSPLPKFIQNKKEIVNVKNEDERCFGYAIASALHPINRAYHTNQPQLYLLYLEQHHLNEIEYPVNPTDIPQLEVTLDFLLIFTVTLMTWVKQFTQCTSVDTTTRGTLIFYISMGIMHGSKTSIDYSPI